jgi:hypothetical protein
VLPSRAKPLGTELPRAAVLVTGLCERLARHLTIRGEGHMELSASRRGGDERFAIEKRCANVAGRHGFRSEGGASDEECACDGECFSAHSSLGLFDAAEQIIVCL